MIDLSAVIITYHEESNIRRCIASLPKGCEVVVVDSFSSDKTTTIAESLGAKVYQRKFSDYASQKNTAIGYALKKWVLCMDADEQLNEGLRQKITEICLKDCENVAYRLPRRLVFMETLLTFGKTCDNPVRLFRNGVGKFEGKIHEVLTFPPNVKIEKVRGDKSYLLHFSYDNLTDYFEKFNSYTSRMALELEAKNFPVPSTIVRATRPWFEFFLRYFLRLGFLDGYPGYCYALISSVYKFTKYEKLNELYVKKNKLSKS